MGLTTGINSDIQGYTGIYPIAPLATMGLTPGIYGYIRDSPPPSRHGAHPGDTGIYRLRLIYGINAPHPGGMRGYTG